MYTHSVISATVIMHCTCSSKTAKLKQKTKGTGEKKWTGTKVLVDMVDVSKRKLFMCCALIRFPSKTTPRLNHEWIRPGITQ